MKKIVALMASGIFYFYSAKAQVASSDAETLKVLFANPMTQGTYQDASKILAQYLPQNTTDTTADLVRLTYLSNPFLNQNDIPSSASYFSFSSQNSSLPLGNAISQIGGMDVTSFADGLAKFLIKRAKQELLISFFSNLQDTSKYPEFRILFPNTKILVDNFNSWEYANIINTLREAFNKDLKQLMGGIPNLATLDPAQANYNDAAKKRITAVKNFFATDKGRLFISALQIGNGFTAGQKIPDIIHTVCGVNYLYGISGLTNDEKSIIKLLDILSFSIRSNTYGRSYISGQDFASLLSDPVKSKIYLGLLYQKLKSENVIIAGTDVADLLVRANTIQDFVKKLISGADSLGAAFTKLSEAKKKGETDLDTYWGAIFENANSFFQSAIDLQTINPAFRFPPGLRKALDLSTSTLEIAHDISVKNYSAAVTATLTFITQNLNNSNEIAGLKSFFVKYGSLAANIVEAKNSDEAEKAIEAAALPVGSASIKKKTQFNIALNAYLGGFYGNEYLGEKKIANWRAISGVYAPIGITFSKGINYNGKNYGSVSALINIIDIGAIASYRLQDTSTAKLPKVTLQNILAPGLGIIYGVPRWPISIGYSYQFGPALREINSTDKVVSEKLNRRWQFFLAVDIPLLNFYTKSR